MKPFSVFIKESDWQPGFRLFQKEDGSWHKIVPLDEHGEIPPGDTPATDSEIEAWKKRCENKS